MNQLLFEGRSLVGIVSSVIRQDNLRVAYSRLDWERMYRLADFHKVANIVYIGLLGYRETVPDKWRGRFFKRYQESLLFSENCDDSLKEVLTWLDMREISCTILTSEAVRGLYKISETAENSPVHIFLDEEKHLVCVQKVPCELTYKEYELLKLLLRNRGIVLSRDTIMERIWGIDFEGESRTLDVHIKTLRQKLGSAASNIRTVRNVGYTIE